MRPSSLKARLATVRVREKPAQSALTRNEMRDHFGRVLAGSKWEMMRGYHTLRHSFCSILAARGIDQRFIDEWMGHQTEQQRRRYRHLAPNAQRDAMAGAF